MILYYYLQKKRGKFIDFNNNNNPLLVDVVLMEKLANNKLPQEVF